MSTTLPPEPSATPRLGELFLSTFTKLSSVQPGERVLGLCAHDDEAMLEAARRSGAEGEQLALHSDPARLESLLSRARQEDLTTLRGEVLVGSHLPGPDSYWDIVICHLALPQLDDPETALAESKRVLRPVGRLSVSTWGQRERCPLITIFLDAITPYSPAAARLDKAIFHYSEAGQLANTLAAAGFEDATPERLTEWPTFRDVDDYWRTLSGDSRFSVLVQELTSDEVAAAKATIEAKTKFYRRRDGLEIKVEGVVLVAVK